MTDSVDVSGEIGATPIEEGITSEPQPLSNEETPNSSVVEPAGSDPSSSSTTTGTSASAPQELQMPSAHSASQSQGLLFSFSLSSLLLFEFFSCF